MGKEMPDSSLFSIYHGLSYFRPHCSLKEGLLYGHTLKLSLLRVPYHSNTVPDKEKKRGEKERERKRGRERE